MCACRGHVIVIQLQQRSLPLLHSAGKKWQLTIVKIRDHGPNTKEGASIRHRNPSVRLQAFLVQNRTLSGGLSITSDSVQDVLQALFGAFHIAQRFNYARDWIHKVMLHDVNYAERLEEKAIPVAP